MWSLRCARHASRVRAWTSLSASHRRRLRDDPRLHPRPRRVREAGARGRRRRSAAARDAVRCTPGRRSPDRRARRRARSGSRCSSRATRRSSPNPASTSKICSCARRPQSRHRRRVDGRAREARGRAQLRPVRVGRARLEQARARVLSLRSAPCRRASGRCSAWSARRSPRWLHARVNRYQSDAGARAGDDETKHPWRLRRWPASRSLRPIPQRPVTGGEAADDASSTSSPRSAFVPASCSCEPRTCNGPLTQT